MSTEAIFGSSQSEKINQFLMLIKDPEVQPIFRMYIENILATSELNILKRLAAIETLLGLCLLYTSIQAGGSGRMKDVFPLCNLQDRNLITIFFHLQLSKFSIISILSCLVMILRQLI